MKDQEGNELKVGMSVVYHKYNTDLSATDTDMFNPKSALVQTNVSMLGDVMVGLADGTTVAPHVLLIV